MALGRSITGWFAAAGVALLCLYPRAGALAFDMQVGNAAVVVPLEPEPLLSSLVPVGGFSNGSLIADGAIGYDVSPLGQVGAAPVVMHSLNTAVAVSDITDISGEYATHVSSSSDIGVFGHMAERQSPFNFLPATAWDVGGSFGYGGFYVRAGLSATSALGPIQATQGWQAGFGFATGSLDLRVTYLTAQTAGTLLSPGGELDSEQWTLGGIYALTPRLRLNADAFYGMRDSRSLGFFTPANGTQAPQGTGARLGIQLRF